jgi:hypothetical protein
MAALEIPLRWRILRTTGDVLLRAELVLGIKTNQGTWKNLRFRVDPGPEMTTMPAADARGHDLPIPKNAVPGLNLKGEAVRSGLLRARIVGLDPTEFVFPCYFLGDPSLSPPSQSINLLGLTGVINQIHLGFDGTPSLRAPWGNLVVEKR